MDGTVSLKEAQFWVNIYLEMLAVDQHALRRIRELARKHAGPAEDYEPDFEVMQSDIARVFGRLRHWEELVDKLKR